jgi:hypothetical protein
VQAVIGDWEAQLKGNKNAYTAEFVQRRRSLDVFPLAMTSA